MKTLLTLISSLALATVTTAQEITIARAGSQPVQQGPAENFTGTVRVERLFGAVDYETYGMQQVEVLRSPSSSLYGSVLPAGIINQVQKHARLTNFGEVGLVWTVTTASTCSST